MRESLPDSGDGDEAAEIDASGSTNGSSEQATSSSGGSGGVRSDSRAREAALATLDAAKVLFVDGSGDYRDIFPPELKRTDPGQDYLRPGKSTRSDQVSLTAEDKYTFWVAVLGANDTCWFAMDVAPGGSNEPGRRFAKDTGLPECSASQGLGQTFTATGWEEG